MGEIILTKYQDSQKAIYMQTSRRRWIKNCQQSVLLDSEELTSQRAEAKFESKFHGEICTLYNCHGLTFAARRTGIFEDEEVQKILDDEYIEIKNHSQSQVGDVVIYYSEGIGIAHSGLIIFAKHTPNDLSEVRVLSKEKKYREIIHLIVKTPYFHTEYKIFRFNHDAPIRISG